jgi:hypothetical protein
MPGRTSPEVGPCLLPLGEYTKPGAVGYASDPIQATNLMIANTAKGKTIERLTTGVAYLARFKSRPLAGLAVSAMPC